MERCLENVEEAIPIYTFSASFAMEDPRLLCICYSPSKKMSHIVFGRSEELGLVSLFVIPYRAIVLIRIIVPGQRHRGFHILSRWILECRNGYIFMYEVD